ncbi:uncharacterized protein PV07_00887 [Cladophialophora immunda]|uniref:UTP23 sensor motif region domain-containing protein n=1 Tax=Cladophialophora immunda TaxID=569365 RepID=A0A0D2CSD4_9EURO|nr:uncharacterized protein PV07_00887 [Cladophialophora immunda]KIW34088.1 hypothetical protein PV07_00887 [Cladophialophora immunda]OQV03006.1 hypothetical protein CLAIMM_08109 [Cladophialophora immunda]
MRARRSKRYRKIMSAYQRSFSFHEPYQVLLDSHFLKTCHSFHMPLQKYLENTLHGQCRLFVTRCTLAKIMADWEKVKQKEGRARGPPRPDFLPPPTEVPLRHCKHKDDEGQELGVVSEARCLLDLLAGQPHGNEHAKNKQHYILATADADEKESRAKGFIDVKDRARLIPGVPIVYVKRSVMILEEMSGVSDRTVRSQEKEKFSQGLIGLASRKRKRGEEDGSEDEDDDLLAEENQGPKIRGLKRAKGPNPLSVKKKKAKGRSSNEADHSKTAEGEEERRKKANRRGTRGRREARNKSTPDSQAGGQEIRQAAAIAEA